MDGRAYRGLDGNGLVGAGLGGLHMEGEVGLANGLLKQLLTNHLAIGIQLVLPLTAEVNDAEDDIATLVGGDEAVGTDAGNGVVAAAIAGAAIEGGLGGGDDLNGGAAEGVEQDFTGLGIEQGVAGERIEQGRLGGWIEIRIDLFSCTSK